MSTFFFFSLPVTARYVPSVQKKPWRRGQQPPAHSTAPRSPLRQDGATGEAGELRHGPCNAASFTVFERRSPHLRPSALAHRLLSNKIHASHLSSHLRTFMFSTPTSPHYKHIGSLQFAGKMWRCPHYAAFWGIFLNDWLWRHELLTPELPAVVKVMGIHSYEVTFCIKAFILWTFFHPGLIQHWSPLYLKLLLKPNPCDPHPSFISLIIRESQAHSQPYCRRFIGLQTKSGW